MSDVIVCPKCSSEYGYFDGVQNVCAECAFEWTGEMEESVEVVLDANGTILNDGDSVIILKDLKVKGSNQTLKQGTKVKKIRLADEGDHNISCKIDGFGSMNLKSEFVRKG